MLIAFILVLIFTIIIMEIAFILILIFTIIIRDSQVKMLERDKYFLREDNISLKNDFKRLLWGQEIFEEKPQKAGKGKNRKKKKSEKAGKERGRIFIFENAKNEEEVENLVSFRNFLKEHSVNNMILVNLEDLSQSLSDNNNENVIEEISMLENNPDNLPIIFCGEDYEYFMDFLFSYGWEDRGDMEWVENPWDIDELKEIIEEMSEER